MFNIKKLITLILFIVFFVLNLSFASTNSLWDNVVFWFLDALKDLLQSIWVVLAIIAWKLYTNDLLYWVSIWLDSLLWNIWNFSKNIANYIIWFILIVSIFLLFVWKVKNILSIIWKLGIASILVNASWFMIAILIDISVILLAAVWWFPKSLLWNYNISWIKDITYCENIELGFNKKDNPQNIINNIYSCNKDNEKTVTNTEELLSSMNDMTWPLFYIWTSILNIDKELNIDVDNVSFWGDALKTVSISFILHLILILLFTVPILLLIIIWIIRVFWIWIYIAFSPLIFLDQVFWWKVWTKHKAFLFKNMIWLIFQPVLVVFALWISLIFLISLQWAFISNETNEKAKETLWICEDNSMCIWWEKILTIEWNFMNDIIEWTWWVFGYIILTILSTILLWSMIKLSFKSTDITASISDSVYKFAEEWIKSAPIIPTPYGWIWIWAAQLALQKSNITKSLEAKAATNAENLVNKINDSLWIEQMDLKSTDVARWNEKIVELRSYQNWYQEFKAFLEETAQKYPNLIPRSSLNYKKVVSGFINKMSELNISNKQSYYEAIWLWKDNKAITNYEEMFEQDDFKEFITWLIKNPSQIDSSQTPVALFRKIKENSKTSTLWYSLKDIKNSR